MTTILQVKERIFLNKYVIKRIGLAIVTLVIISLITFFAMNAIPGGPFDTEKATSPEVKAVLEINRLWNSISFIWETCCTVTGG